jgi:hypothetical protein
LLGLHPNTAYRLLRRVLKSILADDVADSGAKPPPEPKVKPSAVTPATNLNELKLNIQRILDRTLER